MKKYLYVILIASFIGCKPTAKSITDFDMCKFHDEYIVLVDPQNNTMFVLIDKKNPRTRFIIWKDMDFEGSGYGYCYSYVPGTDDVLKNGVYSTADEAIKEAKNNLMKQNGTPYWIGQFMPWYSNVWITAGSYSMSELCPPEK